MRHFPIAFALAPKSLGSRISGGALAITARALLMVGHVTVSSDEQHLNTCMF